MQRGVAVGLILCTTFGTVPPVVAAPKRYPVIQFLGYDKTVVENKSFGAKGGGGIVSHAVTVPLGYEKGTGQAVYRHEVYTYNTVYPVNSGKMSNYVLLTNADGSTRALRTKGEWYANLPEALLMMGVPTSRVRPELREVLKASPKAMAQLDQADREAMASDGWTMTGMWMGVGGLVLACIGAGLAMNAMDSRSLPTGQFGLMFGGLAMAGLSPILAFPNISRHEYLAKNHIYHAVAAWNDGK